MGSRSRGDGRGQDDLLRKTVRSVLNLVLGALATWLAGRITEWILGPADPEEPGSPED